MCALFILTLSLFVGIGAVTFTNVGLWNCGAENQNGTQTWYLNSSSTPGLVKIWSPSSGTFNVWDLNGPSNASGTVIHLVYSYDTNSQLWSHVNGLLRSDYAPGMCATAIAAAAGFPLVLEPCGSLTYSRQQNFSYDENSHALTLVAGSTPSTLCADAGSSASCSLPPFNAYLYCNQNASPEDRAADLAVRLDAASLSTLLSNQNFGLPAFGLGRINYGEALHGMLLNCLPSSITPAPGSTGCATSFPHALLLSGTFNRSLWLAIATAISDEGRAYYNAVNGSSHLITWAPDINSFREPRWGRGQEVAGEDPFLISEYIYEYARGMETGEDSRVTKVVSSAKHYSSYDFENNTFGENRISFVAQITLQDAARFYWPPFVSAVQRGGVSSVMCSYNSVQFINATGPAALPIPSCMDSSINNDMLRGEWGFEGFIVSDCDAIGLAYSAHRAFPNATAASAAGILGGCDVDCGSTYTENLVMAVEEGLVTLADLQQAAQRNLRVAFELGIYDAPGSNAYDFYGLEKLDSPAHRALALEAAIQGMVLLKNEPAPTTPLLPIRTGAGLQRVAVVGPNSKSAQALLSNYAGQNLLVNNHSVLDAITARGAAEGFTVTYAPGCTNSTGLPNLWCQEDTGFAAAVAAADAADLTIAVMGLCSICEFDGWRLEGEGHDRINITLPGLQESLLQALAATGKPIIVVLIHGGPLAIEWTAANMPAILDAHYPGELGGDAVSAVLFGDASPSGRLTTTVYPAAFITQRNSTDMILAPHTDPVSGGAIPGITHMFYDGPVLFPFGWGLSYTTFTFQWFNSSSHLAVPSLSAFGKGHADVAPYAVNITNVGNVVSDVSVLAFIDASSGGGGGEPLQQLFDFGRLSALAPGASAIVSFNLPPAAVAIVDEAGDAWLHPGERRIRIGEPGNYLVGSLSLGGKGDDSPFLLKAFPRSAIGLV